MGIEVARAKSGKFISQKKYALDLLENSGKLGSQATETPIDHNHKLSEKDGLLLSDVGKYQRLVDCLLFLSLTRPNIVYDKRFVNQHKHAARVQQLEALERIHR